MPSVDSSLPFRHTSIINHSWISGWQPLRERKHSRNTTPLYLQPSWLSLCLHVATRQTCHSVGDITNFEMLSRSASMIAQTPGLPYDNDDDDDDSWPVSPWWRHPRVRVVTWIFEPESSVAVFPGPQSPGAALTTWSVSPHLNLYRILTLTTLLTPLTTRVSPAKSRSFHADLGPVWSRPCL